ncbi:MAG: GNAT family N-acetyltransferase [Pseudomonadota bacterium]
MSASSFSALFDEWYNWAMEPLRQSVTRPRLTEEVQPEDCRDLAALHEASFPSGWGEDDLQRMLADEAVLARLVRPLGLLGAGPAEGFILARRAADEGEILTIAVDPRARSRGLGAQLLDAALFELRVHGVQAVFLEVAETNVAAVRLYRRRGFRTVGERPAYSTAEDGSKARALVMRRQYE